MGIGESKKEILQIIFNTTYNNLLNNKAWIEHCKKLKMDDKEIEKALKTQADYSIQRLKDLEPKIFELNQKNVFYKEPID